MSSTSSKFHSPGLLNNDLDHDGGVFRAWWFEPFVATISFAIAIHVYWYEERKRGLSRDNRLLDTFVLQTSDLWNSLGAYWIGIWILKLICMNITVTATAIIIIPDGFPTDLDSFAFLIGEVIAGILLYDAAFFFIHWAMHEIPCLRALHFRHHSDASLLLETNDEADDNYNSKSSPSLVIIEARDVLRHSIVDGSLQVLCNILVQQFNPWPDGGRKSRLARVLHNIIVTWMLAESHSSSPTPNIFRRYFVGVREHRLHHLSSLDSDPSSIICCYFGVVDDDGNDRKTTKIHRHQQFFGYLDNLRAWIIAYYRFGTMDFEQRSKLKRR